jgi:ABC-type amino acid transport substrate-binding protein
MKQWTVGSGQKTVDSGEWVVGSEKPRQESTGSLKRVLSSRPFGFTVHYPLSTVHSLRVGTLPVVILAFVLLAIWSVVNWWPKPPPKPDPTWVQIVQDGVFRIGIDPSFPPFETDDSKGHVSGFDAALADEMVHDWSQQTGSPIQIQYVYTGFDGLYDALKTGQYDAILSALPYDPTKTEDVRFSHSYFNGGPAVIVREGDTMVKSWQDLAGRRIGVELGSSGDTFARKWQRRLKYDLQEFNTPVDALHALRLGQVEGVFADTIAFDDFLRAEGGVRIVGKPLTDELFVIAVRKTSPTLMDRVNAVIDAMKRDGRMERLQAEWF